MDDSAYENVWMMMLGHSRQEQKSRDFEKMEPAEAVAYALQVQGELGDFIAELIARAKAEDEAAAARAEANRKAFGERYSKADAADADARIKPRGTK